MALNPVTPQEKRRGGARPGAGRPRRTDWQDVFLTTYKANNGGIDATSDEVGVAWSTVYAERDRNPAFAQELEHAKQVIIDRCERQLVGIGHGQKGNPLGLFGYLRANAPDRYNEKITALTFQQTTVNVFSDQHVRALFHALRQNLTPASRDLPEVQLLLTAAAAGAGGAEP